MPEPTDETAGARIDLDEVVRELAAIAARLDGLAPDDLAARTALEDRRRELHRTAREAASDPSDPAARARLVEELEVLRKRWLDLQRERIDVVKQAGDLAAGNFGFTADAVRLNRAIDEAGGRAELEARIRRLRELLDEGGG
ncbi:MAG TPA: hypothetical protein VLD62_00075 [Acidimicrobiia bacterium]|nr:hypothetical protein [Acidimicrobiia bacterium]